MLAGLPWGFVSFKKSLDWVSLSSTLEDALVSSHL